MAAARPSLSIDFVAGPLGYRLRRGEGRGQALARAAGLAPGKSPQIVDATAGLGRDAFVLASLGARVTLIERSAPVHAALAEALDRARAHDAALAEIVDRMTLLFGDSIALLEKLSPEVVMVDPMHPPRRKSALVKKEMRDLRDLVGGDPDSPALLAAALAAARARVVVKWPLREPLPEGLPAPSHAILGKTTRYEVFIKH